VTFGSNYKSLLVEKSAFAGALRPAEQTKSALQSKLSANFFAKKAMICAL
jgi:hypothetical protein